VSCGKPHEIDCTQILNEVYLFLDLECAHDRRDLIQQHLDECSACLREYGIEQEVRALVHRCCSNERAPTELRDRLRLKIASLVLESREPG
jgi:mycothiol system anti-sigma-R factor